MKNNFGFFIPGELEKSTDKNGVEKMQFSGIASTTDEDTDEEILLPSGFDLSYFLKSGYVNWHHRQKDKPSAIIGEPSEAKIIANGKQMKVVCDLYNTPLAKEVYDLGVVLKNQSTSGRRLGFSIEGKVLERDKKNPKIVTKAAITGCAITYQPKNSSTVADIVKADGADPDYDLTVDMDALVEDLALLGQDGGKEILKACEEDSVMLKDVSGDLDAQNFETTEEDEEKEDEVEKDLTSNSPSGKAIQPESVDKEIKDSRPAFLSKSEVQEFMDYSGIEVDIESFITFINKIKDSNNMATKANAGNKVTADDLQKAMEFLEKAGTLSKADQPDEIESDEDEDDEEEEVSKAQNVGLDTIEKAVQTMASNYAEGFGAIKTLLVGFKTELDSVKTENELLKAQVDELNSSPVAQRKAMTRTAGTKAIEKSFETDQLNGNGGGDKVLSISRNKPQIVGQLEQLTFDNNGFNEVFAKSMTTFESSSQLDSNAMEALRKLGFDLVQ